MAEAVAGAGGAAAPSIRPIPALRLHYVNALLVELDREGPIPLSELMDRLARDGRVEDVFKSDREHRSPFERAQQLMRYARELELVRGEGGELSLTGVGRAYVRAGDPQDVFATTSRQRRVLRGQLLSSLRTGNGVARGVALTLAILGDKPGATDTQLGRALAERGNMDGWREERTFEAQGQRFRALAADASLLALNGEPSSAGRELLRELDDGGAPPAPPAPPALRRPRAWIVRAGRRGRYEQLALSQGVCLIGWSELGPLSPGVTRDELKRRIEQVYDEHRPASLASQAGQVFRFLDEIAVGDVVVLPLMSDPGFVAVGRVTGGYRHRDDGPFAGTDAQHTRPVEWIGQRFPRERFDPKLRAALDQQGTVSEIGLPDAVGRVLVPLPPAPQSAAATHLVLKWSARLAVDTIERHVEVAQARGAVWWGRVSRPGAVGLAGRWIGTLRDQLARDVPTFVYLRGATTWRTRLLAIATDRLEVEEDLVPAYYDPATHHSLWVKLTDFAPVDPAEIMDRFVLARNGGPVTEGGLANQTPLILRGPAPESAASVAPRSPAFDPPPLGPPLFEDDDAIGPDADMPATVDDPPAPPPPPAPTRPLDLATLRKAAEARGLRLPDRVYAHVLAVLRSGRHVILTGPPGTAKTTLALAIAEAAERVGWCAGHLPTTATADWTTYETIGGLRPTDRGPLEFEEGHFVTAIRENRWLVIDELNRSQFDRAFGQLFTVLSGHRVVLPYRSAGERHGRPLALVPAGVAPLHDRHDCVQIPEGWRIVATMNVFDKTLLFDMSFALMRRFGFVEVGSPDPDTFGALIDGRADGDARAAQLARALLPLRELKDVGPAIFMDLAGFLRERIALDGADDDGQLLFEAFYSFLLPQFEGIQARGGTELHETLGRLVGPSRQADLRRTLKAVLGLELDHADAAGGADGAAPPAETAPDAT